MNRRHFLQATGLGAALHAFPYHLLAGGTKKNATDRILLGPRKIEVSRLAMGSGTNGVGGSSNQTRKLGTQGLADLFRAGYDQGVTFWDSADQYGTHPNVKLALKGIPREKVTILTKTHASTEREMRADLDRFQLARPEERRHGGHFRSPGERDCADQRRLLPRSRRDEDRGAQSLGRGGPRTHQSCAGLHGRNTRHNSLRPEGNEGRRQRRHRNENSRRGRTAPSSR